MNHEKFETMLRVYRRHERQRSYALDAHAKRQLLALFLAALETREQQDVLPVFHKLLEKLTDQHGANLLRPKPREPKKIPPPWKDAHGRELPNPFATGDAKGQRILRTHDKELAEFYEQQAKNPYEFEQRLREEERERVEQNRIESEYTAEIHSQNVFVDPSANETDRTDFVQTHPKRASIWKRESLPARANVFGRDQNQTIRSRIYKTDTDLWRVVEAAEKANDKLRAEEAVQAQRDREAAEAKLSELRHKIERPSDGRIITAMR
jgi:hypothetical protein